MVTVTACRGEELRIRLMRRTIREGEGLNV